MDNEQTPALRVAVENMANMREAYNNLSQAAEAYNTGKTELAANITAKGVEASATETLPELADKVNAISQESYTIDGGEIYAKQLYGSLTTPNYWNLYEVLAQLLSDGRLVTYGGILLAEYYRGYDSLALAGAGAGGAYVVSDKDENGQFKMYTEDTTHVWIKEFDGKGNRWVAYCFADEYHDFQITDTNTSPRSIFIGRNVGVIKAMTNTRLSKIVVPDGNKLHGFNANGYSQEWDKQIVIRNLWNSTTPILNGNAATIEQLYISGNSLSAPITGALNTNYSKLACLIIEATSLDTLISASNNMNLDSLKTIIVKHEEGNFAITAYNFRSLNALKEICFIDIESANITYSRSSAVQMQLVFNYKNNDKTKSISLTHAASAALNGWAAVDNVLLKEGWCKPIDINLCSALTEANMYTNILQHLKQDEPDCGDGVTITLGSANLAKLTSAESVALLDELTNIYGYTFA